LHDLQEGGTSCNVHLNAGAFHPTHGSINGDRYGNIHEKEKITTFFCDLCYSRCWLRARWLIQEHKDGASVTAQEVISKYNQLRISRATYFKVFRRFSHNSSGGFKLLRSYHPVNDNYKNIKELLVMSHASHDKIKRVQGCQSKFTTFGATTLLKNFTDFLYVFSF